MRKILNNKGPKKGKSNFADVARTPYEHFHSLDGMSLNQSN